MRLEFDCPAVGNESQGSNDMTWNDDLEANDFDREVLKVLLLAFFDGDAKASRMSS